jgi:hypothetical protein
MYLHLYLFVVVVGTLRLINQYLGFSFQFRYGSKALPNFWLVAPASEQLISTRGHRPPRAATAIVPVPRQPPSMCIRWSGPGWLGSLPTFIGVARREHVPSLSQTNGPTQAWAQPSFLERASTAAAPRVKQHLATRCKCNHKSQRAKNAELFSTWTYTSSSSM